MTITPAVTSRLDQMIAALSEGERGWARESLAARRALLMDVHANVAAKAEEWVRVAATIKQLPAASPLLGEEWTSGPWAVLGYLPALAETLTRLEQGRDLLDGYRVGTAPRRPCGHRRVAAPGLRPAAAQWLHCRGLDGAGRDRA
nr:hypothetical protein GCM10020092_104490 [Actinoplanes digitatis]